VVLHWAETAPAYIFIHICMYIYFVGRVLSRGRGVLLIVLCDGPDKKRNDFWPGPLATRPAELWELENKIRWGRQGGLGGWAVGRLKR